MKADSADVIRFTTTLKVLCVVSVFELIWGGALCSYYPKCNLLILTAIFSTIGITPVISKILLGSFIPSASFEYQYFPKPIFFILFFSLSLSVFLLPVLNQCSIKQSTCNQYHLDRLFQQIPTNPNKFGVTIANVNYEGKIISFNYPLNYYNRLRTADSIKLCLKTGLLGFNFFEADSTWVVK